MHGTFFFALVNNYGFIRLAMAVSFDDLSMKLAKFKFGLVDVNCSTTDTILGKFVGKADSYFA